MNLRRRGGGLEGEREDVRGGGQQLVRGAVEQPRLRLLLLLLLRLLGEEAGEGGDGPVRDAARHDLLEVRELRGDVERE